MKKNLDNVLKHALTPTIEPDFWLNQKILNYEKEQTGMKGKRKSMSVAVLVAAVVLCLSSVTVYAAWKYLSPAQVAGEMQDNSLAKAFFSEEALVINESQESGGYRVTLLSMVSGAMISDYETVLERGSIQEEKTYAVVAIENADGTAFSKPWEETYENPEFFVSPLIGGYSPMVYNLASMGGSYGEIWSEGILYQLIECDNVEIFADRALYLCVNEGMFYDAEAYVYENATGEIKRNEEYEGLNALFILPVDETKANPVKAAEYMAGLGLESDIIEEKLNLDWQVSESGKEIWEVFGIDEAEGNRGAEVVEYALQFVGNPYAWGCDSLIEGTDSSGFTKSVYAYFDMSLPHSSVEQRKLGEQIDALANALPGDLVFYETPTHVAIYMGNNKVIHAMPQIGICVSEADFDEIVEIRRVAEEK